MKIVLKTFCSVLGLVLGLNTFAAKAQDVSEDTTKPRAILFKIHDIQPVMNTDGVVKSCDFLVTFYNRTGESLRDAKLNLGWNDEVTSRYSFENDVQNNKKVSGNSRGSNQAKLASEVMVTVDLPALGSYKQTTVKSTVETEKCFLLLDKLNFSVESCSMLNNENPAQNNSGRSGRFNNRGNSECANWFQYVDSKNPEYYDEFKNISYSEQERLIAGVKKQDTTEIQNTYDQVSENLEKITKTLDTIK